MASLTQPPVLIPTECNIPTYHQAPETTFDLDWADLATLDLALFDQPGGKEQLAKQLFEAIQKIGFFYITNFGLSQEEVDRQFSIGEAIFKLPIEEKLKFRAELEKGAYNGYKPIGLQEIIPGVRDKTEIYNIPKFIPALKLPQPDIVNHNRPVIESFARHIHDKIVGKLLTLFAIILELPEDCFLKVHRYDEKSDCHLRYMKYHRRTDEENEKAKGIWIKGHTDFGSLTLLFRQPIAALQVRTPDGEWKWVKPYPESITVNLADSLDFLTNGFLKSSIHRVVVPPPDQRNVDRLGVLYFVRPEDSLELRPVVSEVLRRLGYNQTSENSAVGITAGEWVKARVSKGIGRDFARGEVGDQPIIGGVVTKYYD
ncbi:Oxoglutarate/iron-dependent dioxygenase [Penicillium coprophilum]|uniref:Oxoglutarate/iron-dependent dioxygenase n=1 Tax=Penicillium coprophilum TaxID=36646 RepID=UPI00239E223D|nr:Oxoglutarate/iron-dependent dioxygenase [Penicillium coprophilum]KAJ5169353.1 Oxoglutarate/iron-dependent dioxygenase [Penicillium coprophilum]